MLRRLVVGTVFSLWRCPLLLGDSSFSSKKLYIENCTLSMAVEGRSSIHSVCNVASYVEADLVHDYFVLAGGS